jgi:hypothetical protein
MWEVSGMKVLGVLCSCKFCSPNKVAYWYPCGCRIGQEIPEHLSGHKVEGIVIEGEFYSWDKVVHTGGRNAIWIYLEDGEEAVWLSANKRGKRFENEVARFPASVHGCWKVVKNQELVIIKVR